MRIAIVSFTVHGRQTSLQLKNYLKAQGDAVRAWDGRKGSAEEDRLLHGLREWTGERFEDSDALIFVGAAGIAVRSVAPYIESKAHDPAVLVIDERGQFAVSLLSGHLGGANELCLKAAQAVGAVPVITTATDINGKFAVDVFAKKNHLRISDLKLAKEISAAILNDQPVGFCSDLPLAGVIPQELHAQGTPQLGICVSYDEQKSPFAKTLHLVPQTAVLGIGCRRGKHAEELTAFVKKVLSDHHISQYALTKVCSITLKADEPGIWELCKLLDLPFEVYSAGQLRNQDGEYSSSSFVEQTTGVDNICERSAVLGSSGGRLIVHKIAENGMTAAIAVEERRLDFE